ncbi:MAG: hypothetical protein HQK49_04145 [Oligoflexia bacterium]|nr:hypothetical protein [Oligoflexia bacterium]
MTAQAFIFKLNALFAVLTVNAVVYVLSLFFFTSFTLINPSFAANPQLKDLSAKSINPDASVEMTFHDEKPAFYLDAKILNSGNIQGYSDFIYKEDLATDYPIFNGIIQKIDQFGIMKAAGDRLNVNKLVYLLPKVKAIQFNRELVNDAKYVSATNKGVYVLDPLYGPNNVRIQKDIPVLSDVINEYNVKEFSINRKEIDQSLIDILNKTLHPELVAADRTNVSEQVDTNYPLLTKSISISQYYDLPDGSGVLFVSHSISSVDFYELGRIARAIAERIPRSTRINTFIDESVDSVERNRYYFK